MLLAKAGGESAVSIAVRLGHHLDWFLWDEQTRGSDVDRTDTLSGQAVTGGYDHTQFALAREPQPSWSYWKRSWPCQRWSNRELCEEESP